MKPADPEADPVLRRLVEWGEQQGAVRAMLLTSTRAHPGALVDAFSDYDVVLVVPDIHPFYEDRSWLQDFGRVLVAYWDPIHPAPRYGIEKFANVIQYEAGTKIDFNLCPVELLHRIAEDPVLPPDLDVGYRVLLDKDRLTEGLKRPSYRAYIPAPPTEETYLRLVEEFFVDATSVGKNLRRDELMPAKYALDCGMKHEYLRRMLEWRMELDHNWDAKTGAHGKGLKRRLPPDLWDELEGTFAGAGIEEIWEALFKTIGLFRKASIAVAEHLGFVYPDDLQQRVIAHLQRVKGLDPGLESVTR